MTLFGLQPDAVQSRIERGQAVVKLPSLGRSLVMGTLGFTLASLVVYGSWALHGRAMYQSFGEGGAYAIWAVVFIALAGGLLNPLVIGPGSLGRFYALFATAFTAYAVLWSASWFLVRGRAGEWAGSLIGSAALALLLCAGFGTGRGRWKTVLVLFLLHSAGYFTGSFLHDIIRGAGPDHWLHQAFDRSTRSWMAKLSWGLAYGAGLGAGLGYALHQGQSGIRFALGIADRSGATGVPREPGAIEDPPRQTP